jgi:hypothetical protein
MSGDHNQYQKGSVLQQPDQEWKYNPMTGEPLVDGWPLYSGLPQREWVSLTDEEISELIRNTHNTGSFVRAIEDKLRSKNES